jgi:hypothetical protein
VTGVQTCALPIFFESIPKGALWGAGGLMILWILAWLVFLIIGLSVLAG